MNATELSVESFTPKETWSVVVVYEDKPTREQAMVVCDHLARQFLAEVEFKFHWWRTDFLEDPDMAAAAAENASTADFIIFCGVPEDNFSTALQEWFEEWIARREGREGALIDLTGAVAMTTDAAHHKQTYLRDVAQRAMMDYLTQWPTVVFGALPDSFESVEKRAHQTTWVLDNILHQLPPSSHYGLNE